MGPLTDGAQSEVGIYVPPRFTSVIHRLLVNCLAHFCRHHIIEYHEELGRGSMLLHVVMARGWKHVWTGTNLHVGRALTSSIAIFVGPSGAAAGL